MLGLSAEAWEFLLLLCSPARSKEQQGLRTWLEGQGACEQAQAGHRCLIQPYLPGGNHAHWFAHLSPSLHCLSEVESGLAPAQAPQTLGTL